MAPMTMKQIITLPGPPLWKAAPDPTKRPAPTLAPGQLVRLISRNEGGYGPIAIICMCRLLSLVASYKEFQ